MAVLVMELSISQGWSYVGDRLLSAVIPYEETGWYDGQMWVKPPEVSGFSFVHSHYHLWGNGFGGLDSHFLKIKYSGKILGVVHKSIQKRNATGNINKYTKPK